MAEKLPLGAKILQKTAEYLELPADIVAGAPRVTMIGRGEVQIYNHTGLKEYGDRELQFHTRRGDVTVRGDHLRLRAMNRDEVYIIGSIASVSFSGEETADE